MAHELDVVQLRHAIPGAGLAAGTQGTIVHAYPVQPPLYIVEFSEDEDAGLEALIDLTEDDFDVVWSPAPVSATPGAASPAA